jgi:ribosomal protein S18 acetylase RimI-like enzyme
VVDLWRRSGLTISPSDRPREIERARRRDPDLFVVAVEDDTIVGAVLGRFDGRRGWINHLAVSPTHRSAGLGSRLMAEVERRLSGKGCAKVNLHVLSENAAACAFYERIGYGRREMIFMDKWLRRPDAPSPRPGRR